MTNPRGKINLITLGCSKNLVDSERLLNQFSLNGFEAIHDSSDASADIVIINTCGFIDAAKEESIDTILQYAAARKRGTLKKLLVMGCLSERYSRELAQEIPEVDKFYGKFDFRSIIADLNASFFEHKFYSRLQTTPSHFAYLKISEGCNRTCSFCAIPQFTGKYRSRQPESLIDEAHALADTGVKELLLIAQDLTYYGIDLCGKSRLADLLCRLADVDGIDRIRLHYTFPAGFPLDVLDVINTCPNICNYLDIPLQHISDNMLRLMRRNISRRDTLSLLETIRRKVPGIALRTTFLVGHPGETEQDFDELKTFVRDFRFERMGVFAFSNEENTYAWKHYRDDVSPELKEMRVAELMELQQSISLEYNNSLINSTLSVIIDREESEFFVGRTEFDSPEVDGEVFIEKSDIIRIGRIYPVTITGAYEFDLMGKIKINNINIINTDNYGDEMYNY